MTAPHHPLTGQYVSPAVTGLPSGDLVNQELATKPDSPDGESAVPDIPDHVTALNTGAMPMDLPAGPDDDEAVAGSDSGYAA